MRVGRRYRAATGVLLLVATAGGMLWLERLPAPKPPAPAAAAPLAALPAPAPAAPPGELLEAVVARNDTLEQIFRREQLKLQDLAELRTDPVVRAHLDRLTPGEKLQLWHEAEQLTE